MDPAHPTPESGGAAIRAEDLVVRYRRQTVLNGFSLEVRRGEAFAFLGPNGAGKTSTIKCLLGLVRPDSGRILLDGLPPADPASRRRVGFLPEAWYYRYLTPSEILGFYGGLFGLSRKVLKDRSKALLEEVGLGAVAAKPIGKFSKGMVQKVGLAQALIADPEILILDEPTSGLDPLARMQLRSLLEDLRGRGKTIFFSSHELSEVELMADTIAIVNRGRVIRSGPLKQVLGEAGEGHLERFFMDTIRGDAG
ncbi:MAG: ABC transporter ATP-binding protein [Candidatus Omnitrophica bacterium]|nr:ABC transporter ATP-binding protein [Candidatus Omnitrophota bacterium]